MFPEFEVCNTTRSTITEVPFPCTVGVLNILLDFDSDSIFTKHVSAAIKSK